MGFSEDEHVRDIRNDLRERLSALSGRYADQMHEYEAQREALDSHHRRVIEAVERERLAVQQLLEIEERREGSPTLEIEPLRRRVALADFLIAKICAHGPIDKDALRSEAIAAGYENDGRTFHATLMNVEKHAKVRKTPDGRYVGPEQTTGLFGMGDQQQEAAAVN
jgi:hypothetical protein